MKNDNTSDGCRFDARRKCSAVLGAVALDVGNLKITLKKRADNRRALPFGFARRRRDRLLSGRWISAPALRRFRHDAAVDTSLRRVRADCRTVARRSAASPQHKADHESSSSSRELVVTTLNTGVM